jgi:hypothetical protein
MKRLKLDTFDPFTALVVVLAVALGIAGKVDWWVVILILLSHVHLRIRL